ncbi:tRNA (N(6)-L-threonylcarbamoyladenosine(37)-C(2))-methylthiotransferase MtaB [Oribacterium sp. HCP28S3_H8]|uniref:tRNA (N(6)-L-threonylcarbamoyladenosine(37)-C(2))- methylthiotransferase MtaB n=1 Tax=Oribacterium sp. HCP28S3_H8 TaxID=3438945 RepID=UPI003F889794
MELNNLKVAMHNLGCKVNSYEAEAMVNELREAGAQVVSWEDDTADVYIINTCSVTNIADRKSRQMLHKAKAKNPDAIVIGVGCYVQARAEELKKEGAVDILVGNNEKSDIVPIVQEYLRGQRENDAESYIPDIKEETTYENLRVGEIEDRARAFIKIQDGCNQYCSYCIIPYVRGRIRSRSEEDTLREIRELADRGYKEIVLTGIHLSSYGIDFDDQNYEYVMNHDIPSARLLHLIEEAAEVPGIERIRLGSLEPRIITESFVERLRAISEICPHFHLSLQSGCDRTLRAMNRHYDTASFRHSVELLRKAFARVAITTDVIVGFPGETQEDFEASRRFIEEMRFYELHVFKYSRRHGTVADRMPEQITDRVKSERSEQLISMNRIQSDVFRRQFLEQTDEVLPEEIITVDGREYLTGFNKEYVKYLIPFTDRSRAQGEIGEIIRVHGNKICKTYVLADSVNLL